MGKILSDGTFRAQCKLYIASMLPVSPHFPQLSTNDEDYDRRGLDDFDKVNQTSHCEQTRLTCGTDFRR